MGADGHEDGVETPLGLFFHEVVDGMVEDDLDAEVGETCYFGVEDFAR
jgi:hypothetical protein